MAKNWAERDGLAAPGGASGDRDQRADGDRSGTTGHTATLGRAALRWEQLSALSLFQGMSPQRRAQKNRSLESPAQQQSRT